jgi:hypothetical protein
VLLHEAHVALALAAPFFGETKAGALLLVFLLQVGPRHERRVHGVEREIREERPILVRRDELHGLGGEPVGEVFAVGAVGEPRIAIGREVALAAIGTAAVVATEVVVEALILGPPALGAEVPLAGEERGVAGGLQRFCERGRIERQPVGVGRRQELGVALPCLRVRGADVVGDAGALRPLAGEDAGARGRANGARGVGIGEFRTVAREAIEIRCLVKRAAIDREIALAEIVGEEENDVGLRRSGEGGGGQRQQAPGNKGNAKIVHHGRA